jgi:hypothetical protein
MTLIILTNEWPDIQLRCSVVNLRLVWYSIKT